VIGKRPKSLDTAPSALVRAWKLDTAGASFFNSTTASTFPATFLAGDVALLPA
jgi:hypothetical protein